MYLRVRYLHTHLDSQTSAVHAIGEDQMPNFEKTDKRVDIASDNAPKWPSFLELHEQRTEPREKPTGPREPQTNLKSEIKATDNSTANALALNMFSGGFGLSTSQSLLRANYPNPSAMMPLTEYLTARDEQDKQQSYYKTFTTAASRLSRRALGIEDASAKFSRAVKDGDSQEMLKWQEADRKQRQLEQNIGNYSAAILKTGLLFCGPKTSYIGLIGLSAADQASPSDSIGKQAADALLGSAKGAASRYMFDRINSTSLNPASKGWLFGLSDRLLDVGLTSNTYLTKDGDFTPDSLKSGLWRTGESVFGPDALKADAATLLVSHAVMLPIGYARGGAFFANPLYAKATMAGVSGLTNGSLTELNRQQELPGQPTIDWWEVSKRGAEKAALSTISALPASKMLQVLEQKK